MNCLWDFRFFLKREARDVIFEKLGVYYVVRVTFFYVWIILLIVIIFGTFTHDYILIQHDKHY